MSQHILDKLYLLLQERKDAKPDDSYVASLYKAGTPRIAQKVLEEAQEFIEEAIALDHHPDDEFTQEFEGNIRNEAADLFFHALVMMARHNVPPKDVFAILEDRFGTSGHDEKASRTA